MTVISGTIDPPSVVVPVQEALRYMRTPAEHSTPQLLSTLEDCLRDLQAVLQPRYCALRVPIMRCDGKTLDLGCIQFHSTSLCRHLQGCSEVILFAATIGPGADRLMTRYARLSPVRHLMLDALGSVAIEAVCDMVEKELTGDIPHKSRFSPGYGDLPLEAQRELTQLLDMQRRIGVTLTGSLLMTPTKSVTAIIGSGSGDPHHSNCEICPQVDCAYRKEKD